MLELLEDRVTPAVPVVTLVDPVFGLGLGGNLVTISGQSFTEAIAVDFGASPATFSVVSDTEIDAWAPTYPGNLQTFAHQLVDVTVTNASGTSSTGAPDEYDYLGYYESGWGGGPGGGGSGGSGSGGSGSNGGGSAGSDASPLVTAVAPTQGPTTGGNTVIISGEYFTGATQVDFGNIPTMFTFVSDTEIDALAPGSAAGTVDVTVTNASGTSATGPQDDYTYFAAIAPTVTGVTPNQGPTAGGTTVTITGQAFTDAVAVDFGGVPTTFSVVSDTEIEATAPAESAGTVDVTVATPQGVSNTGAQDQFTYTTGSSAPDVTSVNPNQGPITGGTSVTITGQGFTGASVVDFGSASASFAVVSNTQITATAPAQSAGTVDVTVTTANGTSGTSMQDKYTYSATTGAPSVTSVSPSQGPTSGGTSATITGQGFTGASAVDFGTTAASSFTVVSNTQITATAPAASAGMVYVTVTTPQGTSGTGMQDQYTFTAGTGPTASSVSPSQGPTSGGTSVTITGQGFTDASAVSFGMTSASSFTVVSATTITATAPAESSGTVDVTVSTPTGTSPTGTLDRFTFANASSPSVTAASPDTGPTSGGTSVTITGQGFTGASAVAFGNLPVGSFTVVSNTEITTTAPADSAGMVNVTVTTAGGTSPTGIPDEYTYTASSAPSVTGVAPNQGPTSGGTSVTITGQGFTGATTVDFGSVPVSSFTIVSNTQITTTAPAQSAGTVDVTVTTSAGMSPTGMQDHYVYSAPVAPAITGVNQGSIRGGTTVTITGEEPGTY